MKFVEEVKHNIPMHLKGKKSVIGVNQIEGKCEKFFPPGPIETFRLIGLDWLRLTYLPLEKKQIPWIFIIIDLFSPDFCDYLSA